MALQVRITVGAGAVVKPLPTRQQNALRILLEKCDFTPAEISRLDYLQLIRAPGIGHKGISIIRSWLLEHGCAQSHWPTQGESRVRDVQTANKVERAIELLHKHGYQVQRPGS